jgi:DNA-binding PadR family transcriptional regulator
MKPQIFHMLLALVNADLHGYGIMQAVRDQSGGQVPLRTGSFYRHLGTLIDQGLVAEAPAPDGVFDARRGTHYRLTSRGRDALSAERHRLRDLLALMEPKRIPVDPGTP